MKKSLWIAAAWAAISIAAPAAPQPTATTPSSSETEKITLWKDLYFQQDVNSVVKTLASYPEVRSVKQATTRPGKAPEIKIKLVDAKFQVFGIGFDVQPEFNTEALLKAVTISSGSECANKSRTLIQSVYNALSDKYGKELSGNSVPSDSDISLLLLKSYETKHSEKSTYVFANETVAVVFVAGFNFAPPPDAYYGGGLAGSLSQISRSLYETAGQACENSGNKRAAYILQYMPRSAFDEVMKRTQESIERDSKQSSGNL